jgi:hypothetical protein
MRTHAEIIDRLGGQGPVAVMLRRNKSTVSRWATYGIPPHAWPIVLQLARQKRLGLTLEQLAEASPRFGTEGTARNRIPLSIAQASL